MNIKKDVPIFVLAASILVSTVIYVAFPRQEIATQPAKTSTDTNYVSSVQYKKDLTDIVKLIVQVGKKANDNEWCLNHLYVSAISSQTVSC
jgi:hypothetical protein